MQIFARFSACVALLASCVLSAPVVRRDLLISATNMNVDLSSVALSEPAVTTTTLSLASKRMAMPIMDYEAAHKYAEHMRKFINKCDFREIVSQCDRARLQSLYKVFEVETAYLASAYELDRDAAHEAQLDIEGNEVPSDVYQVERSLGAFERDVSCAGQTRMLGSLDKVDGLVQKLALDYTRLEEMLPAQGSPDYHSVPFTQDPEASPTPGVEQVISASASSTPTTSVQTVTSATVPTQA